MSGVSCETGENLLLPIVYCDLHPLNTNLFLHLLLEGRCVLGKKCLHPEQELRAEHKCPDCGNVDHVLCGVFDKERDKYVCGCKNDTSHLAEIDVTANE